MEESHQIDTGCCSATPVRYWMKKTHPVKNVMRRVMQASVHNERRGDQLRQRKQAAGERSRPADRPQHQQTGPKSPRSEAKAGRGQEGGRGRKGSGGGQDEADRGAGRETKRGRGKRKEEPSQQSKEDNNAAAEAGGKRRGTSWSRPRHGTSAALCEAARDRQSRGASVSRVVVRDAVVRET